MDGEEKNNEEKAEDTKVGKVEAKLLKQQHEIDKLKIIVEEKMKTMKAENEASLSKNETAIERLQAAIERLRADMERNANSMREKSDSDMMKIMVGLGIATAFLGGVIAYVGLFAGGA